MTTPGRTSDAGPGPGGPDPGRVQTLAELATELESLRRRAARGTRAGKVSLAELAHRVDVPRSTVHAYVSGLTLPPAEVLDRLVIALGADAAEQAAWAEAWFRAAAAVDRRRRARGDRPAADPAVPRQLPPGVPAFTGRAEQLAGLDRLLAADGPAAVLVSAIAGTAGVGKTALALHWAHRVADRFPDGHLYLDLRGYDPEAPTAPADALAAVLRALGVPDADLPPTAAERSARFRTLVAGRRMLVVLDNAGTAEQVRPLLPGSPSCCTLITSRDALAGLVARDGVDRLDLDLLPAAEAVALLRALVGPRVDAEPEAAGALVQRCGRLPLALRVAAELARARPDRPLARLVAEFEAEGGRLDLLDAAGDPRAGVRAVFSWSHRQLPVDAGRLFRLLGRFPGPTFDAYAAAALAGIPPADAARLLDRLTEAHLVHDRGAGRHGLHDLLRAYAAGLPDDEGGERGEAVERLLDHYRAAADAAVRAVYPLHHGRLPPIPRTDAPVPPLPDEAAGRAWLTAGLDPLLAAVRYAADRGFARHAVDLAMILWRHLDTVGRWDDAVEVHRAALRAARAAGDRPGEAGALRNLGMLLDGRGRHGEALEHLEPALAIRRELGDVPGTAAALTSIGVTLHAMGRFEAAIERHEQVHDLYRDVGDLLGAAGALLNLGVVQEQRGDLDRAADHHGRALAAFRSAGDRLGEAHALTNLGNLRRLGGDPAAARDHLTAALARYREVGSRAGEAYARTGLGAVEHLLGDARAAIAEHDAALRIAREIGAAGLEAENLSRTGQALLALGRTGDASAALRLAGTVARDSGNTYEHARAEHLLGTAALAEHRPDRAAGHHERARRLFGVLGVPPDGPGRRDLAVVPARPATDGAAARRDPAGGPGR